MAGTRTRITMTTAQRASAAGGELLELLVDITRDGELTEEEVARLGNWLVDNEEATKLPAVGFLRDIVTRIVDDCRLDADEVLDLACAIERVLPKARPDAANAKVRLQPADDGGALLGSAGHRAARTVRRERVDGPLLRRGSRPPCLMGVVEAGERRLRTSGPAGEGADRHRLPRPGQGGAEVGAYRGAAAT